MKIIINKKEAKKITFPYLMQSKTSPELIVLMYARGRGVALQGDGFSYTGEHSETWNDENFTPFEGSITLSNKD